MIKGIQPTLSEAGKIKIGHKGEWKTSRSGKPWRVPVKLDHFLITTREREKDKEGKEDKDGNFILDGELMNSVLKGLKRANKDYGDTIKEIPIVLHSDDIDEVFPTAYAWYSGKKIGCRGDGETACRWEIKGGNYTGRKGEVKCPCKFLNEKGKCKPNGTLHCSIAVPGHAVAGAVHKWRTTSIISIQRMIGSLSQIKSVCGTLRGIPLWLRLEAVRVDQGEVYCCHVELRAKDLLDVQKKALELASMRAALGGQDFGYKGLIEPPASERETKEESADVQEEFYPEVIDADTGEITEGLNKFSSNDKELWGFEEATYEDSSSVADGTPPASNSKSETRKEEKQPLKSEKVA